MTYKTILTAYGLAKENASKVTGNSTTLETMVLGSGATAEDDPDHAQAALLHEVARFAVNRVYHDPADPAGMYTVEGIAPTTLAGTVVNECGVIDTAGGLYLVGTLPPITIPAAGSGASTGTTLRIKVAVANGASITIQDNPAAIYATQAWVIAQLTPAQIIPGGTTGQVLTKATNTDGDVQWADPDTANVVIDTIEEVIDLAAGQTSVTLTLTTTRGLALYLDGERLAESDWVPSTNTTVLTLVNPPSAPAKLIACQNEPTANTPNPLVRAKNLSDVPDKAVARNNLGGLYTKSEVDALFDAITPIGLTAYFDGTSPPARWLVRNGAAISRTTYAKLFAVIGTRYGAGNGSTTFNLPDDRGIFERGLDLGRGIDSGRTLGSEQSWSTAAPRTTTPTSVAGDGSAKSAMGGGAANPSTVTFVRVSRSGEIVTAGSLDSQSAGYEVDLINPVLGDAETRPINRARLPIIRAY